MSFLHLFEGYGIELEYMIVDRDTLQIRPISDRLLTAAAGELTSDFEDGSITWSNELVLHVLELKTTGPASRLANLGSEFHRSLAFASELLARENARLMPTAMHPLMNPDEMCLWPHDNNEIYAAYNRIFDCRGHGWSNLQSMHINLPFANDSEFERLHTAIRFLLPILPALAASSPVVEGRLTGSHDNRLVYYQQNQKRIPSIAGQVIPEYVRSMEDYHQTILARTYRDIAPHDPDEILRDDWLNSRGAITRFGRQTIEIRILDLQECPTADLAIAELVCSTIRQLTEGRLVSRETQASFTTESLKAIFDETVRTAETAQISEDYLRAWGASGSAGDLWKRIFETQLKNLSPLHSETLDRMLQKGSLATRITKALEEKRPLMEIYRSLANTLDANQLFEA